MNTYAVYFLIAVMGYLLGSIPFALVIGAAVALTGGIDLTRRLPALRKR